MNNLLLVADSGSSKTNWSLVNKDDKSVQHFTTSGINPLFQDDESIYKMLREEYPIVADKPVSVFFYGSGCINEAVNETVKIAVEKYFNASSVQIYTDLMAAARSLCQDSEGIACILGTGSNSCYYDGKTIVNNISPLGYVLGDEGSGAVLGKKLVADLLKNQLPANVSAEFFNMYDLRPHQIVEQVYKKPFPNRFLAQFTRFILSHIKEPAINNLVLNSFVEFFDRNISQYPKAKNIPVKFTGSVAFHFEQLLKVAANKTGYKIDKITCSPMEGLVEYHLHHQFTLI